MPPGELLVIGHRNPDTDAICSAIGYAEFKRRTGSPHAIAARCGDTNDRIDFVLQTFGISAPRFVADVSPKVRDVMRREIVSVTPQATLVQAIGLMDEQDIRVLPILDTSGRCQGLVSIFKMNKFFCPSSKGSFDSRRVSVSMDSLVRTLNAQILIPVNMDQEEELVLMIGGMSAESFSNRLHKFPPAKLIIIVGDRREIQELAIHGKARAIVVTGGTAVDPDLAEAAKEEGVCVMISPHDSATTMLLCRGAVAVVHMAKQDFLSFPEEELLAEAQAIAANSPFHVFPVLNPDNRVIGILEKTDFLKKVKRQLILVDHNELSQAVVGADQVEILEIIDHHRIGSLTTTQPILFRNEPVGSTSTIVADCFFRNQVDLPKPIAGLLLAGLVSDTLNLNSPTTTARDRQILKRLEEVAQIRANEFTDKLFASGSILTAMPASQAVNIDCKEFQEQGRTFSIAQIEELGFDQFWARKEDLAKELESHRRQKNYFFAALLLTDVLRKTSLLLITGAEVFVKKIDYPQVKPGVYELAGVVSRKKQLLPYLIHRLDKSGTRSTWVEPVTMV